MDAALDLLRELLRAHPAEAGRDLELLGSEETAAILADAVPDEGAPVLASMSAMAAADALEHMETLSAVALACRLEPPVAALLLRRLPMPVRRNILTACPDPWKTTLASALRAPSHAVGAVMDARAPAFPQDWTVEDVTRLLGGQPGLLGLELFVVDRAYRLRGRLDLRRLDSARAARELSGVMVPEPPRLPIGAAIRFVGDDPLWQRFDALPVVDENGLFVGVLPHRAVRGWKRPAEGAEDDSAGGAFVEFAELAWRGYIAAVEVVSAVTTVAAAPSQETIHGAEDPS
jgi:Mg/Co/Ni transporter MgtE